MAAPPRILFVADAGPAVGGGHVMRCLTLAGALRRAVAECGFVATAEAEAVLDGFAAPEIRRFKAPSGDPASRDGQPDGLVSPPDDRPDA